DLQAFHLGNLPEAELDVVAEHLESCSRCEAAVRKFDSSFDPLLAALRKPMPAGLSSLGSGFAAQGGTGSHRHADPASHAEWPQPPAYEILAYLGRGAMGLVYEARHRGLGRRVALKRLRPQNDRDRARSRREAEALARLHHPNIIQIYEVFDHDDHTYLSLELAPGDRKSVG